MKVFCLLVNTERGAREKEKVPRREIDTAPAARKEKKCKNLKLSRYIQRHFFKKMGDRRHFFFSFLDEYIYVLYINMSSVECFKSIELHSLTCIRLGQNIKIMAILNYNNSTKPTFNSQQTGYEVHIYKNVENLNLVLVMFCVTLFWRTTQSLHKHFTEY